MIDNTPSTIKVYVNQTVDAGVSAGVPTGLTFSFSGSVFTVAAGEYQGATNYTLTAPLNKYYKNSWSAGTYGGLLLEELETGYTGKLQVYIIKKGALVDVCASKEETPTFPSGYNKNAKIGYILLNNGDITDCHPVKDLVTTFVEKDYAEPATTLAGYGITDGATKTELTTHTSDSTIHVTTADKEQWNAKQDALTAGQNIQIESGVISATDTTYTAGTNVTIDNGVISSENTTYTAGSNIQISNENVISATDTTYTAGTGISIDNGVISSTQTSAEWGNITGTLSEQTDLQNELNNKQHTLTAGTGIEISNNVISATNTGAAWGQITGTIGSQTDLQNALSGKQETLVSGTNIKTINNTSLLGTGNIDIQPGATSFSSITGDPMDNTALALALNGKADTATTLAGYGITDAYTKTEIDGMVSAGMHYKGTVASASNLPSSGNQIGDLYNVTDTGANYAWNGTDWDKLSENIDLSGLASKDEAAGSLSGSNATLTLKNVNGGTLSTVTVNNVANATQATKATQDASGNVITSTYSTKAETVTGVVAGSTADKINVTKNGSTSTITVNNVANATSATSATSATKDSAGNTISTYYAPKATTIAGYGITDAYTKTQVDTLIPARSGLVVRKYTNQSTTTVATDLTFSNYTTVLVYKNGLLLWETTDPSVTIYDYTLSGSNIVFTEALTASAKITVVASGYTGTIS